MNRKFLAAVVVLALAIVLAVCVRSAFVEARKTVVEVNKTVQSFSSAVNSLPGGSSIDVTETKHTHIQLGAPTAAAAVNRKHRSTKAAPKSASSQRSCPCSNATP